MMKVLLLFLLVSSSLMGQNLLSKAHAHNDYEHERPFYEAFSLGFGSIEVDVYAVNGLLLVAHDVKDLKASRTFQNLYLDPLVQVLTSGKAGNYHQLLIDSKTSSAVAPARSACCTETIRPSVGVLICSSRESLVSGSSPQWNDEPRRSRLRRAF